MKKSYSGSHNLQCVEAAILLIHRISSENLDDTLSDEKIIQNCKDIEMLKRIMKHFINPEEEP